MAADTRGSVLAALGANLVVAAAKFTGGILTGSAALMAEGGHSVADTLNELLLLRSLRQAAREPDVLHPFGYGAERFFWALLAAVGIFVAGAGFSLVEAYRAFSSPEHAGGNYFPIAYATLAIAGVAEAVSWLRAIGQLRTEAQARGRSLVEHIRRSSDPSVKTVASEDTAALIGIAVAAVGVVLHQLTGDSRWEGGSALVIAGLLVFVAYALGRDSKSLLIGEAADPELRDGVVRFLGEEVPGVEEVVDLLTMTIGTDAVLLAARIDLRDDLSSGDVEQLSAEVDAQLRERWPEIREVFLDATRAAERVRRVGLPRA